MAITTSRQLPDFEKMAQAYEELARQTRLFVNLPGCNPEIAHQLLKLDTLMPSVERIREDLVKELRKDLSRDSTQALTPYINQTLTQDLVQTLTETLDSAFNVSLDEFRIQSSIRERELNAK